MSVATREIEYTAQECMDWCDDLMREAAVLEASGDQEGARRNVVAAMLLHGHAQERFRDGKEFSRVYEA